MRLRIAALMVLGVVCRAPGPAAAPPVVEPAFPGLRFQYPIDLQNAGDGTNRLFVAEMPGVIRVFENRADVDTAGVFLDIRDRVTWTDRFGLLGFAFHPDYETNGWFFVNYVAPNPDRTVIARYRVSAADAGVADRDSEAILLEVEQPGRAHNGGQLAFGPDGYLYIGLGDGGLHRRRSGSRQPRPAARHVPGGHAAHRRRPQRARPRLRDPA
jgi:glucose/arabinose dehydrogenase